MKRNRKLLSFFSFIVYIFACENIAIWNRFYSCGIERRIVIAKNRLKAHTIPVESPFESRGKTFSPSHLPQPFLVALLHTDVDVENEELFIPSVASLVPLFPITLEWNSIIYSSTLFFFLHIFENVIVPHLWSISR